MTVSMRNAYRLSVLLTVPFLITGCGMPIGIQIASLLADSVSIFTTDKTLTDHGLSAITDKDCMLWRGMTGEEVCQDNPMPLNKLPEATSTTANSAPEAKKPELVLWKNTVAQTHTNYISEIPKSKFSMKDPATENLSPPYNSPSSSKALSLKTKFDRPSISVAQTRPDTPITNNSPLKRINSADLFRIKQFARLTPQPEARQIYLIIASYHHKTFASRFLKRHRELLPVILRGIARGRKVYRVAIGPIAQDIRKSMKQTLINKGFQDTWELALNQSSIELAALN